MSNQSYASVFPIHVNVFEGRWPESELHTQFCDSIKFEDVSALMEQTPPDFWTTWSHDFGQSETNRLRNTRYALVRRFECAGSEEAFEREKSKKLLYQFYLSLKVIRATKERFVVLPYTLGKGDPIVRDPWRNEFDNQLLDCEFGFPVRPGDLCELARISQQSIGILGDRRLPITQATYNLEIGYRAEFFNVRHLLWVVGLEALFSSRKRGHQGADVVKMRALNFLGEDFAIYDNQRESGLPRLIGISLRDALNEIYVLRNHFAHGTWPQNQWAGKVCRPLVFGTGHVTYSGMLLEAAASILRGCLRKILADDKWVSMFNDKKKMNAYFAELGLVRQQGPKCTARRRG